MDYWEILGIDDYASQEEIRKAYLIKARETHPDKGGTAAQFRKVNQAYEFLKNQKFEEKKDSWCSPPSPPRRKKQPSPPPYQSPPRRNYSFHRDPFQPPPKSFDSEEFAERFAGGRKYRTGMY